MTATVMVVDDDDLVRKYIGVLLGSASYQVITLPDAEQVMAALEAGGRPDLLLTDVLLNSNTNGFQLAIAARRIMPDLKVLYSSGYAHLDHFADAPATFDVLAKPYSRKTCLDVVARILAGEPSGVSRPL